MIDQSGFASYLESLPLPEQGSNRGYPPVQLFLQFMSGVWCGADRYAHLDIARLDRSLQHLYGWKKMPEHKAFERYFRKFDIPTCYEVFGNLYRWLFNNLKFDNFTLDIDSSVITRYGEQEGSAKGYNRHKPGRKSQHPLLAFVADIEMVANFWLRSGDAYTANNFKAFLEETLCFLRDKKIGLLRLDSGFYDKAIFDYLETRDTPIDYIAAVPMYGTIQRKIAAQRTWLKIEDGIEITEFEYQAQDWEKPRRMINGHFGFIYPSRKGNIHLRVQRLTGTFRIPNSMRFWMGTDKHCKSKINRNQRNRQHRGLQIWFSVWEVYMFIVISIKIFSIMNDSNFEKRWGIADFQPQTLASLPRCLVLK